MSSSGCDGFEMAGVPGTVTAPDINTYHEDAQAVLDLVLPGKVKFCVVIKRKSRLAALDAD